MEVNTSDEFKNVMFINKKIVQEMFNSEFSVNELGECEAVEFLTAAKAIHITMQNIIGNKLIDIVGTEPVEKEESAFDDYDIENGYEEEQQEINYWKACSDIVDRIIKLSIRLLNNSYSQCLKEDIIELIKYLKFELDTINEN